VTADDELVSTMKLSLAGQTLGRLRLTILAYDAVAGTVDHEQPVLSGNAVFQDLDGCRCHVQVLGVDVHGRPSSC